MVKRVAGGQLDRAVGEPAEADLGALQVDQDADRVAASRRWPRGRRGRSASWSA